jgi:VanZ family protein
MIRPYVLLGRKRVSRGLTNVNGQLLWRWSTVILWMGLIFALSSIPSIETRLEPTYDFTVKKLAHVTVYGILTALLFRALLMHIRHKGYALVTAALVAVLYAFSDEWHQTFVPGREGTVRDVAFDAVGAVGMSIWLRIKP